MFEKLLVQDILQNPALLGLLFAIIRNIGGYAYNCFAAKKLLPYSASMFLETLALYETFFIALGGLADLPANHYVTISVVLDVIRSVKKAVQENVSNVPTPSPEPTPPSTPGPAKVCFSGTVLNKDTLQRIMGAELRVTDANKNGYTALSDMAGSVVVYLLESVLPATEMKVTAAGYKTWRLLNPEPGAFIFDLEEIATASPTSHLAKIGESFTIAQIKEFLAAGYKTWTFPDGTVHPMLLPTGSAVGQMLTTAGWTAIMPPDWKPAETHQ